MPPEFGGKILMGTEWKKKPGNVVLKAPGFQVPSANTVKCGKQRDAKKIFIVAYLIYQS